MEESDNSQELINFRTEIVKLSNGVNSVKSNDAGESQSELVATQYINIHRVSDSLNKEYVDCDSPAASSLINAELMQHHVVHGGMVVDMMVSQSQMPTDYSQHHIERTSLPQYIPEHYDTTEDLLPHDLTEEDRHLAAALVAVQLSHQQKQLDHHSMVTTESNVIVSPGGTQRIIGSIAHMVNKEHHHMTTLSPLSPVPVDKPAMAAMVSSYIQTVEEVEAASNVQHLVREHHHGERIMKMYQPQPQHQEMRLPPLPPLKKVLSNHSMGVRNQYLRPQILDVSRQPTDTLTIEIDGRLHQLVDQQHVIQEHDDLIKEEVQYVVKNEGLGLYYEESNDTPQNKNDSDYDVENDMRSSRRSLPHKKRIPRKLKNIKSSPVPPRNVNNVKCFKCNKCGEQCESAGILAAHRLTHATGKKLFNCEICSKGFANQLKFFEHLKSHYEPLMNAMNNGSEPCSAKLKDPKTVKETFEPPDSKNDESEVKESVIPPSHSCVQCGKTFRRLKTLETHINLTHPKEEEIEEFSEPEDLMEGIREVVEVGGVETGDEGDMDGLPSPRSLKNNHDKDWYPDDELHAAEADIQELEQLEHQQQQQLQQTVEQDNQCNYCGEVFDDKDNVELHIHEAHYDFIKDELCQEEDGASPPKTRRNNNAGAAPKRTRKGGPHLACPQCGRLFNHRNSLVYHLRSHSGERPHQCEVCGKSFFANSALKVHMRLHSGDKPYKCESCGRHFRQWGDLKYHCISIHSEEKNYQCEYCGKDFARKYSLIVHRRIHTGEKNYKCEFCEKSFRASSYLQNHRRIHTGEKPHPCEICGKPFRVRSDMKRHLNTHNRDRERIRGTNVTNQTIEAHLLHNTEPKLEEQDPDLIHSALHDVHSMSENSVAEITIQHDGNDTESILPDENLIESGVDQEPINLNIAVPTIDSRQSHLHQQLTTATQVTEEVLHYSRDNGSTLYVWPVFMT